MSGRACRPCPAGTVPDGVSAARCLYCPANHYAPANSTRCTVCDRGHVSREGSAECSACPPGTRWVDGSAAGGGGSANSAASPAASPAQANFRCVECPPGTHGWTHANLSGLAVARGCLACPPGHMCESGVKSACPRAFGAYGGAARCTQCLSLIHI